MQKIEWNLERQVHDSIYILKETWILMGLLMAYHLHLKNLFCCYSYPFIWKTMRRIDFFITVLPGLCEKRQSFGYEEENERLLTVDQSWAPVEGEGKVLRVLPSGRSLPRNQGWVNFSETRLVTVMKSLHRSCWTELTCQGILLP